MSGLRALLWDVDGTLAETERDGHRVAFNRAFEEFDLPFRWDVDHYGHLLHVAGGLERLRVDLAQRAAELSSEQDREQLARDLHARKNERYGDLVRGGGIRLRDGVHELIEECRSRGLAMGITTTTSRSNLDALLSAQIGEDWRASFAAVVNGEDVVRKKPDPEVYAIALEQIGVAPSAVVAIEDSPDGVEAACRAGVAVVVTRSRYFATDPHEEAMAVGPGLHTKDGWTPAADASAGSRVGLDDIAAWHARHETTEPGRPTAPAET